jgi:type IV pilus assembly protein PilV
MTHSPPRIGGCNRTTQRGAYLLEALIALLVFVFGIVGMNGVTAYAIRATNDARFRSEASNVANAMVAEMWTTTAAQAATDFGTGGTRLTAYQNLAASLLPNALATVDLTQAGLSSQSRTVVVTITWQQPGSADTHRYVTSAQIGTNR